MAQPVLLPPPEPCERPLPRWVVPVALIGLAVVCTSLVPAALEHRRLEAYHARLQVETRRQEQQVMQLQKRLRQSRNDRLLRAQALQNLLNPR
jgi:hypothetical protein